MHKFEQHEFVLRSLENIFTNGLSVQVKTCLKPHSRTFASSAFLVAMLALVLDKEWTDFSGSAEEI